MEFRPHNYGEGPRFPTGPDAVFPLPSVCRRKDDGQPWTRSVYPCERGGVRYRQGRSRRSNFLRVPHRWNEAGEGPTLHPRTRKFKSRPTLPTTVVTKGPRHLDLGLGSLRSDGPRRLYLPVSSSPSSSGPWARPDPRDGYGVPQRV